MPCVLQYNVFCYSPSRGNIFQLFLSAVILFIFSSYSTALLLSGNARRAILPNGPSVSLQGAVRNTNSADAVCGEDKAGSVVKGGKEGALIQAIDAALVTWSNRTL